MNKLFVLMLLLSSVSSADVLHVPPSIEMIKQCDNTIQRQSTQIRSDERGMNNYSYSSALSVSSSKTVVTDKDAKGEKSVNECTLTIRTVKPCLDSACRQVIDFMPVSAAKLTKSK